jgi:hypothetical protein
MRDRRRIQDSDNRLGGNLMPTESEFSHGYALLIGVGCYKESRFSVPVTAQDAKDLGRVLTNPQLCAYPENQIVVLANENANKVRILAELDALKDKVQGDSNSTVIIFFSGHGLQQDGYYFLPYETETFNIAGTALANEDFLNKVRQIPAQRLVILFNTCFSGGVGTALSPGIGQLFQFAPVPLGLYDELLKGSGRVIISSSQAGEKSWVMGGANNSLFVAHLLSVLQGHGIQTGSKTVNILDVFKYLSEAVPADADTIGVVQTPILKAYDVTQDFPIALLLGGKGLSFDSATGIKSGTQANRLTQMDSKRKRQLVKALLKCHTMSDRSARDAVLEDLPDDIRSNIQRHSRDRVDVNNIVTICLKYSNGIEELFDIVRDYEGDSIGMREVDKVIVGFSPLGGGKRSNLIEEQSPSPLRPSQKAPARLSGKKSDDKGKNRIRPNPYFHRGPIKLDKQDYFFGREKEVRFLLEALAGGQCISVSGPRRIGKSSLLFRSMNTLIRDRHGLDNHYLLIYIDCQALKETTRPAVYRFLYDKVIDALQDRAATTGISFCLSHALNLPTSNEAVIASFNELMMWVTDQSLQAAFLFDEFETLASNSHLGKGFFEHLRSLSHCYKVAYATSSRSTLYEVTYQDQVVLNSPFFSNFQPIRLGLMELEEAKELINGPISLESHASFTDQDIEFLLDVAGTHPFFLQMACFYLFREKANLTVSNYERARQLFTQEAEDHFQYAWRHLSDGEKALIKDAASHSPMNLPGVERSRALAHKCLVDGQGNLFSSVFAEFAHRQAIPSRTDDGTEPKLPYTSLDYELGLEQMKVRLSPAQTSIFIDFTSLEQQLLENLDRKRQFGPSDGNRSDRARIIRDLNRLALDHLDISFNDLCRTGRFERPLE